MTIVCREARALQPGGGMRFDILYLAGKLVYMYQYMYDPCYMYICTYTKS